MSDTTDTEPKDDVDERPDHDDDTRPEPAIRLPRRRHVSPWSSRRLLLASLVATLLLIPMWLDPATLRELRSVTPTPSPPHDSSPSIDASAPPLPAATADPSSAPAVIFMSDAFERSSRLGWGTADLGGSYSSHVDGAALAVEMGRATVRVGTEGAGFALAGATARDVDVLVSLEIDGRAPGNVAAGPALRATADAMYSVRLGDAGGARTLAIDLTESRGTQLLGGPIALPDLPAGDERLVHVRAQAWGSDPTLIRARAWFAGDPEPDVWHASVIDWTGRLQLAGRVGLGWNVRGFPVSAVDIAFDDLVAWSADLEDAR